MLKGGSRKYFVKLIIDNMLNGKFVKLLRTIPFIFAKSKGWRIILWLFEISNQSRYFWNGPRKLKVLKSKYESSFETAKALTKLFEAMKRNVQIIKNKITINYVKLANAFAEIRVPVDNGHFIHLSLLFSTSHPAWFMLTPPVENPKFWQ